MGVPAPAFKWFLYLIFLDKHFLLDFRRTQSCSHSASRWHRAQILKDCSISQLLRFSFTFRAMPNFWTTSALVTTTWRPWIRNRFAIHSSYFVRISVTTKYSREILYRKKIWFGHQKEESLVNLQLIIYYRFIMRPCQLNVLHTSSYYIFYEHVNIECGKSDPNAAYPQEIAMMMSCRCPRDEAAVLWRVAYCCRPY
jgi:hypothetical protein